MSSFLFNSKAFASTDHLFIVFMKLYDKHRFEYGSSNYEITLQHFNRYFNLKVKEIHTVSYEEFLPVSLRD
jgi:hypothetical protein